MSTQPVLRDYDDDGVPLTHKALGELIDSLHGSLHELHEAHGGVDKIIRELDGEDEDEG